MKTCFLTTSIVAISFLLSGCIAVPVTQTKTAPKLAPLSYEKVLVRCVSGGDKKRGQRLEAQIVDNLKNKGKVFAISQQEVFSTRRNVSILEALRFASNERIHAVLTVTPQGDTYDLKLTDVKTNGNAWLGEVALPSARNPADAIAAKLLESKIVIPTRVIAKRR